MYCHTNERSAVAYIFLMGGGGGGVIRYLEHRTATLRLLQDQREVAVRCANHRTTIHITAIARPPHDHRKTTL